MCSLSHSAGSIPQLNGELLSFDMQPHKCPGGIGHFIDPHVLDPQIKNETNMAGFASKLPSPFPLQVGQRCMDLVSVPFIHLFYHIWVYCLFINKTENAWYSRVIQKIPLCGVNVII
jgi:hypothetical protein